MLIFLDTETTGTEPEDRLCQLAFKTEAGLVVNALFNPMRPISIEDTSFKRFNWVQGQDARTQVVIAGNSISAAAIGGCLNLYWCRALPFNRVPALPAEESGFWRLAFTLRMRCIN